MSWLLWSLFVAALLGCVLAAVFARAMQRGDAAGNGLGQVWFVATLAVAWLVALSLLLIAGLVPLPDDAPVGVSATLLGGVGLALAAAALAAQVVGLPAMSGGRAGGAESWWPASLALAPFAVSMHAAWRGVGLPLPAPVANWGCGALVLGCVVVALRARLVWQRDCNRSPGPRYPALLFAGHSVRVVRAVQDLAGLPGDLCTPTARLVDADGVCWTLRPGRDGALSAGAREADALTIAAVRALILRIATLHPDAGEDARIRRLIARQQDVTALTFVLPGSSE